MAAKAMMLRNGRFGKCPTRGAIMESKKLRDEMQEARRQTTQHREMKRER